MHHLISFDIFSQPDAYLDPGSGSLLIQLIFGAVLGLGVFIRLFWKNIINFFSGGKASEGEVVDPTAIIEDPTEAVTESLPEEPAVTESKLRRKSS